jgi:hypothetical protein
VINHLKLLSGKVVQATINALALQHRLAGIGLRSGLVYYGTDCPKLALAEDLRNASQQEMEGSRLGLGSSCQPYGCFIEMQSAVALLFLLRMVWRGTEGT